MTVQDLIEQLQSQPQDAEVRLAIQPRWAFEHSIGGVAGPDEMREHLKDEFEFDRGDAEDLDDRVLDEIPNVVYIGEGGQMGYLPSCAKVAFDQDWE